MPNQKKFSRRNFLGLSALGALGVTLAACSNNSSSSSSATTTAQDEEQRVVALNTGQLDNLLELGILPVGVAVAKGATGIPEFIRDAYGSTYDLDSIEIVGYRTAPDVEKIAALNPTLILSNNRADASLLEQLREIAPVVTGDGGGENWKNDLITIADAVGKADEAQALLDDYLESAQEIAQALGDNPPTVSFLRTKGTDYQLYGVNSMAGTVAADCGFARPESQQFTDTAGQDISAEQIALADAQYLFYGVGEGGTSPTETPSWSTLQAVQENHAIEVDYESWYMNASLLSATIIRDGLKKIV